MIIRLRVNRSLLPQNIRLQIELFVTARPVFTNFPKDETVNAGTDVTFSCAARGAPKPSIFWTREGSQELMFPGHTYQGHYTVTENGSLSIKAAVRKDEGHYVCSAISQAGASTATVFLQVRKAS